MKTNLRSVNFDSGAPSPSTSCRRGCVTLGLALLTSAIGANAIGCDPELSCAETATCPPSQLDSGAEDARSDGDGTPDELTDGRRDGDDDATGAGGRGGSADGGDAKRIYRRPTLAVPARTSALRLPLSVRARTARTSA
jgi:hypothetical protein